MIETWFIAGALLVAAGVLTSKLASRFGIPALLFFLLIGMLAGSEGIGGIYFDDAFAAQAVGVVALVIILFSGGLGTRWASIRPVLKDGILLSTVAVLISALLVGGFASLVLDLPLTEAVLLGAIVSSTDAAAVFSVLRAKGISLNDEVRSVIEMEAGTNDPMAVFLTIGLIRLLTEPQTQIIDLIPMFVVQMAVGAVSGYVIGRGIVYLINRLHLEYEGLYSVLSIALIFLTYGLVNVLQGNGFLAVYIVGLVLSSADFVHKRALIQFYDGMAWLLEIAMFVVLGLLVFPSELIQVARVGLLFAAFMIIVARPVSVFLTLIPSRMDVRVKGLIGWIGLRGAVPIILAAFPLLAELPNADLFFNLVFFIVLVSVLVQAPLIPKVAQWLGVVSDSTAAMSSTFVPLITPESFVLQTIVPERSSVAGQSLVEIGLPAGALVVLLKRDGKTIVPSGATVLKRGDELTVLANEETHHVVREMLE